MSIIFLISHIVGSITLLILGLAVFIRNPKSATNILFAIFVLEFLIYLVVNYLSLIPGQPIDKVLMWIRLVMAVTSFTGPTALLLAHAFPRSVLTLRLRWVIGLGLLGLASAVSALSPYLFTQVAGYTPNNVPLPAPGPLIAVYLVSVPILWLASFIVLIRKYRQSAGLEKSQLAYFLTGIVINLSYLTILGIIAVNIFKTSAFIPYMPLSFVILSAFIGYAILKRRFLDITPEIARAVSFILFVLIVAAIYVNALFFVGVIWMELPFDSRIILMNAALTLFIILTFQPVYLAVRKFTRKLFFKKLYDEEELMSRTAHAIAESVDLDHLIGQLLNNLLTEIQISKAAFLIIDKHKIDNVFAVGYDHAIFSKSPLEIFLHKKLGSESGAHAFVFQFIDDGALKDLLRQFDIEIIFPIKAGGKEEEEEVALLVLGKKSSGDMYAARDLKFLDLFSAQASVAIQKAKAYSSLKVSSESKSRFISVVSHQLRTPISGIRWSLEMLNQEDLKGDDRKVFLNNAYKSAVFLGDQVDDILTALDIYDKKLFIKKDKCDLYQTCKDILEESSEQIKPKKLTVSFSIDPQASQLQADHEKLKKILKTLIKNAIAYSLPGGEIKISSRSTTVEDKKRVEVSVSDQGIGITESERDHVFEEFFRSDKARTALPDGLGLGMFLAQAFVRAHDGEMWFYSEGRGKGADFHFALPMD